MKAWKFFVTLTFAALATTAYAADDDDDVDRPGICEDTEDCTDGYQCVALQTTREETETVKQCLPKVNDSDICSGQYAGLCPTFSSWVAPYNEISSVCTYFPAEDCAKDPTAKSVEGELLCVSGAVNADGDSVDVIYGCVDFDPTSKELLYGSDDATDLADDMGTVDAVMASCLDTSANSTSGLLCSGQGTCMPFAVGSLNYTCSCNIGYNGTYCEGIESNKCQLPGQCATGVCNLDTQVCECAAGTTGPQCSQCDIDSDEACNTHGTCTANSTCTCDDGWEGLQCTKEVTKVKDDAEDEDDVGTDDSTSTKTSGSISLHFTTNPMSCVAMAVMTVLAIAVVH